MASLTQAHLQRGYRIIGLAFLVLVVAVLGGIGYTSWAKTVITITPLLKPVQTNFTVTVGLADDQAPDRLPGTVTATDVSATVTATPAATGAAVPAHATGTVTLHNDSTHLQPLAAGTRLRSASDVIVRTDARVDLAPKSITTVKVVADPLGPEGEVPPGRWVIVALWSGLQQSIYGVSDAPLTGGTVTGDSTLGVEQLTAAVDAARQKLTDDLGQAEDGVWRGLTPISVVTTPPADQPSASYSVAVTMRQVTVTYPAAAVITAAQAALREKVHAEQRLVSMSKPVLSMTDTAAGDTATLTVTAKGHAAIRPAHPLLAPASYLNLDREAIQKKLLGSGFIAASDVRFAPWWRDAAGSSAARITIVTAAPAKAK